MKLITVQGLTVSYENNTVFHNLSFKVEDGDYLCILGENGSGKTTLMRCMLGFGIRHSGTITCHGFSRRQIGWLPQRTETKKDFPASVSEVVLSGFGGKSLFGLRYTGAQRQQALKNMELLEILPLKDRSFKELSGGQQQKVLLCRALCAADRVLLLDEPVTGLDIASQNELYALIKKLNHNGMTIIMISHDVRRSLCEADTILHIADNDYFFGTTQKYRATGYYQRLKEGGQ